MTRGQQTVLTLLLIRSAQVKEHMFEIMSFLSEDERRRALRYAREEDRLLSAGGAYLVRRKVGKDAEIVRTESGKPYVRDGGIRFNLSHSEGLAIAVFGTLNEVGADVERIREGFDGLRPHVFTPPEQESGLDFFTLFTAKESLAKAAGTGLLPSPKDFPALPPDGPVFFRERLYYRHTLTFEGYRISVCQEHTDLTLQKEICHEPSRPNLSAEPV